MSAFPTDPLLGFGILAGGIALAALATDARLALLGLLAQYAGSAIVMAASSQGIAGLHLAVGGLAAVILYLGIRARPANSAERATILRLPFRIVALLLTVAAGGVLAAQWPLPYASGLASLACYGLAAGSVAQMGLFREPARVGMAALALLVAASLYAQSAGGSLLLAGIGLAAHLLTSLAAAHLHGVSIVAGEERE